MEAQSRDTWSGLMLDVEGARARVSVDLDGTAESPQGEVRVTLVTEDKGEETKGRGVAYRAEGDDVRLVFELEGQTTVEVVGRRLPLSHHARAAIYGTYQARGGRAPSLSAGVIVLWLYAGIQ